MSIETRSDSAETRRARFLFLSLAGYSRADLARDLAAGLTLAAIAIPEQMATARLGGFAPQFGFAAFIAGTIAFALFGANRILSVGADSTITPIFAGGLAVLVASGSPDYPALAAALALMAGAILAIAGIARLGWIADLLSVPVVTGFLAGIAVHIIVSQLPATLGLPAPGGDLPARVAALARGIGQANPYTVLLGFGVCAAAMGLERWNRRIPGALIGLVVATILVLVFRLDEKGVAVLGDLGGTLPRPAVPAASLDQLERLIPLALVVALVTMVQTAATARSFPSDGAGSAEVDRDYFGVGMGSLLAGLFGAFPVNASPPRTAIVAETGGRSQLSGLVAAAIVLALALLGSALLAHVPHAALAGVLLFIGLRIIRVRQMLAVVRTAPGESLLIAATVIAIVILPIEIGVAAGIALSLLHGLWSTTRPQVIEYLHVPGTSIWWPPTPRFHGESKTGVLVVAFQAPLSFVNAAGFKRALWSALRRRRDPIALLVLEAGNIIDIDYTAAQVLMKAIQTMRDTGIVVAVARLESQRAQDAFSRLGVEAVIGADHVFQSVQEAVTALGPR
jgi:MFS superfamily sulfate permease-like transporter